jgi:hypothetical protein
VVAIIIMYDNDFQFNFILFYPTTLCVHYGNRNFKMAREEDIKEMAVEVVILIVVETNRIVVAITDKMANKRGIVLIVT